MPTNTPSLTARFDAARKKARDLTAEAAKLIAEGEDKLTEGQRERWQNLRAGAAKAKLEADQLEADWKAEMVNGYRNGTLQGESGDGARTDGYIGQAGPHARFSGNPWSAHNEETAAQTRSRALTAIERWDADDALKASATKTVERLGRDAVNPDAEISAVAEHVIRYSSPEYCNAFRKYVRDPQTFVADLTPREAQAWRSAREHQMRNATLETSGAVLPSPLDPSIVLTNDGAVDPMRSVARVDTTTSKTKRYITSAGSTFSYDAELAEVSDDTFTEAEVEVTTHKGQGWIESSLEVLQDQPDFSSEVARIIADGKGRVDANIFINGTGTNQPFGIEVSLNATASEINAAGEALVADDVYGLLEALPPRFRGNARWQLELSTINFIARLFNPTGTEPPLIDGDMLIRRPFVENSSIDPYSAVNPAITASNRVLFVGDWSNYVILDRVGTQVYFVGPGVIRNAANLLPDGRVGWYAVWRTGAKVLTTSAFRMLDVATVL